MLTKNSYIMRKTMLTLASALIALFLITAFAPAKNSAQARANDENEKWTICHKGETITISRNAWGPHMSHGDTFGPCN